MARLGRLRTVGDMSDDTPTAHTPSPRRRTRTTVTFGAALLLTAGLTLAGCASTSASVSTATATTAATATTTATAAATTDSTAGTIADTTAAADAFLATLTDEQRDAVLYAYDDANKTTSWSNFPVTFVQRAGLNRADLTEEQQTAALAVLHGA